MMKELIRYIEEHSIKVVGHTDTTITVIGQFTQDGIPFSEEVVLKATLKDIRDWLGY